METTTTKIRATEITTEEYHEEETDYEATDWAELAEEEKRKYNVLDPTDYEVAGEKCETYMGVKYCFPVYK